MNSELYIRLKKLVDTLNNHHISSYSEYDELKNNHSLDAMIELLDIDKEFEKEINNFINILESDDYKDKPGQRTIALYQTPLLNGVLSYEYILCLYLNNVDAYRVFPLFLLEACKKFNIMKYKEMTEDSIERILKENNVYLKIGYDNKWQRVLKDAKGRTPDIKYINYKKFKTNHDNNVDIYTIVRETGLSGYKDEEFKELFSVYAEESAYKEECIRLKEVNDSVVLAVASTLGDGFGYDEYSYDPTTNKENLIEVKSTKTGDIDLTINEYEVLLKTKNQPNTDYYVYKYYFNLSTLTLEITRMKYDKENNVLVDENNNAYTLSRYLDHRSTPPKEKVAINKTDKMLEKKIY